MKDRIFSVLLAFVAIAIVWILFLPKPSADAPVSRPLTSDTDPDGYQAVWRWLSREQVPVSVWSTRFEGLQKSHPSGNVLLLSLPFESPPKHGEIEALHAWVRQGNTLVVLAALDDTPEWAAVSARLLNTEVRDVSGLEVSSVAHEEATGERVKQAVQELAGGLSSEIEPRGSHPLMDGVTVLRVVSSLPASRWQVKPQSGIVLNIARVKGSADSALWLQQSGEGQILTSAFAGVFGNANVASAGNGRLLSNLVAWSLKEGGTVLFDDAHQGALHAYDAKRFYADPRLHRSLLWLILLWLVFALGIQSLRRHIPQWRPQDITEFISMSGDFLASTTSPQAVARRLLANFFNDIHRRLNQREDGSPAWGWLAAQRAVNPAEVGTLRVWHERVESGRRIDLVKLQNVLSQLQEKIA